MMMIDNSEDEDYDYEDIMLWGWWWGGGEYDYYQIATKLIQSIQVCNR